MNQSKVLLVLGIVLLILSTLVACSNVSEPSEPSIVQFTYDSNEIYSTLGLGEWDSIKYDRQDTLVAVMEANEVDDLIYIKNGEEVGINFLGSMPDQMVLHEMIIRDDGRELYTYREVKEVPVYWLKDNPFFTVEDNLVSMYSSDSHTYQEGGLLRGYKLTCSFGDNECEYGFVIRSDASHTFSENHTEKGHKLLAESDMNYYALTLSSVPGLPIQVSLTTEDDRHLGVNCTTSEGDFITWDGSYTKQVGSEVRLDEENQTIYWTPLDKNYDGIDQRTVYATVTMEVIDTDTDEVLEVKDYTIYQSYGHFGFDEMPKLPDPDGVHVAGFAIYPVNLESASDYKGGYEIGGTPLFTEADLLNVDWEKQAFYFTSEFLDTLNVFRSGVLTEEAVSNDSLLIGGSVILGSNHHRFVVVVDGICVYEGFFQPSVFSSFAATGAVIRDIEDKGIKIDYLDNGTGDPRFDDRIKEALVDKLN